MLRAIKASTDLRVKEVHLDLEVNQAKLDQAECQDHKGNVGQVESQELTEHLVKKDPQDLVGLWDVVEQPVLQAHVVLME